MGYYTAILVLSMALAVFSQPYSEPVPITGARVSLRILKRNQFGQFRKNQIEGFETSDRFHRVTRNNEQLFGRYNRINKRGTAAISGLMENELESLEQKLHSRDENMDKPGILGFWIF